MESIISFFIHNWQRKVVAVLTAIVIWLFVNHSISETKTIANIPIRVINLPADKTIQGLLPNGMLTRRITLTLTGSKDVIDELESSDLEVLLDASLTDSDEWIIQISKKNLISLNPSIDLSHHISQVSHTDFVINLSRLVTAKIPLTIELPKGKTPQGYEFLDIWPQYLTQTVSGPEEDIQKLKETGLTVIYDLADITKTELDSIKSQGYNDEISFAIPKKWKRVQIPFHNNAYEEFNDPEANNLRIDFLRQDFLPLEREIPIRVFYPLDDLSVINPDNTQLALSTDIQKKDGITIFTRALFAKEVSQLFIEVVQNSMEIVILAAPKTRREVLTWSVQFINPHELENTYLALTIATTNANQPSGILPRKKEELLRKRFRDYMQRLTLYVENAKKLHLKSTVEDKKIRVVAY